MSRMNLDAELRLARTLAREAGRLILEVYSTDFAVVDKGHGDGPVTDADRRANGFLVSELRRAHPTDGIVSEESKDNSDPGRFERCWFIDPLDGTREFVARNGEFAVHVGLAVRGEARLGVVYRPVGDKLYAGVVGGGCELESGGTTRPLRVSERAEPKDLRLVVSRSHRSRKTDRLLELLGVTQTRECGSVGLKCGLLAEGEADLYLHYSPKSSRWDSCAPEAVLRAAGGVFTDIDGNAYRYDVPEILNLRGLFGSNAACRDAVAPAVRQVMQELERTRR
jgi:3'(2'), 5'-bisphosphate nucleotidase